VRPKTKKIIDSQIGEQKKVCGHLLGGGVAVVGGEPGAANMQPNFPS
jgi:hypothetical protein